MGATRVPKAAEAEQARTTVLLKPLGLLGATLAALFSRPANFVGGVWLAIRVGRRSQRGGMVNLVYLAEGCLLLRHLRKRNVEHLHAHFGTNSATVAMLARELGGPPYSFTVHGPEEFDRPEALCLDEKVARSTFAVAISAFGRSQLYRWVGAEDWEKIHVIHCGLDAMF